MSKHKRKKVRKNSNYKRAPAAVVPIREEEKLDILETCPLGEAVCAADPGQVIALLEQGADPNVRIGTQASSDSVLNLAVTRAESAEILRLLLEHGARADDACHLDIYPDGTAARRSALSEAIGKSAEMVRLLLEHGADPNRPDLGFTPAGEPMRDSMLSHAVLCARSAEILRLLLEHGADPDRATDTVCENGYLSRRTVLSAAAVTVQDREMVRLLLEHGADPMAPNVGFAADGRAMEESVLNQLVRSTASPELLRLLLEHGAEPDRAFRLWDGEKGSVCYTPLYDAMKRSRDSETVQLLRAFGAFRMTVGEED